MFFLLPRIGAEVSERERGGTALDYIGRNSHKPLENADGGRVFLRHDVSGDVVDFCPCGDCRSMYRFKSKCAGVQRMADELQLAIYFVTVTLRDEDYGTVNDAVSKFGNSLRMIFRRAGLPFFYVWAVELQRKRYVKYGREFLHWHFGIAVPAYALPNIGSKGPRGGPRDVEEGAIVTLARLQDLWGRGFVWCELARSDLQGYLSKYFSKDYGSLAGFNPAWRSLRRFGASQMNYRAWSKWAYETARQVVEQAPAYGGLQLRKCGGGFRAIAVLADGSELEVARYRSPWHVTLGGVR